MTARFGVRCRHGNLHVATKISQEAHQTIGRKSFEAAVDDRRNLRLIEPEQSGGLRLGQLT